LLLLTIALIYSTLFSSATRVFLEANIEPSPSLATEKLVIQNLED